MEELALPANETSVTLLNLKYSTRYKFYLNAKTVRGAGRAISQEAITIIDEGKLNCCRTEENDKDDVDVHWVFQLGDFILLKARKSVQTRHY